MFFWGPTLKKYILIINKKTVKNSIKTKFQQEKVYNSLIIFFSYSVLCGFEYGKNESCLNSSFDSRTLKRHTYLKPRMFQSKKNSLRVICESFVRNFGVVCKILSLLRTHRRALLALTVFFPLFVVFPVVRRFSHASAASVASKGLLPFPGKSTLDRKITRLL